MKKALITVLVLIIAFGAFSVYGENKIVSTADDLQFTLETVYGDASEAEGLVIKNFIIPFHDGNDRKTGMQKYYIWTVDLKLECEEANTISMSAERDAVRDYASFEKEWPEPIIGLDYVGRQTPETEDLDGNVIYRVRQQDGYYQADIVDKASGNVLHTVKVAECTDGIYVYPRIFAGRGSAVIAIVEDQARTDPRYGWYANNIFCLATDGTIFEIDIKNYTFDGKYFYPTRGTGYIAVSSNGDRMAIVQRDFERTIRNESGEVIGIDWRFNDPSVWIFGPEGLEFLGIIRCSLYEACTCGEYNPNILQDGSEYVRYLSPSFISYETETTVSW